MNSGVMLSKPAGCVIVVTGASGGVGGYAVQHAAADGVQALAQASTGDEEWVGGLGAKEVLPRREADALAAAVRELAPGGVDAALDAGGRDWLDGMAAAKAAGAKRRGPVV